MIHEPLNSLITLAYVPFRDPIPIGDAWLVLLLPLIIVISIVYKTIKLADLSRLPREATQLSATIMVFMLLAAAGLWLLTELV
jgi:TRAP-type C4-dicarboxylate transport system permease large subunit